MATIKINASFFWGDEPPTGEPCSTCEEAIYTKVYFPIMQVGEADKLKFKDIQLRLCEECYLKTLV